MLIRSQNKKSIFNLSESTAISCVNKNENFVITYAYGSGYDVLATYSSEEKAIKVIDEICSFADGMYYALVVPEKCGSISGAVFQMPLDYDMK